MWQYTNSDELYHYGVPGMKWGKRIARGHAGPGRHLTRKRQLAGDKKDLDRLNKGEHLSVGFTKKRQAAYDARDKAALEKRIAKNEAVLKKKEGSKSFDKNKAVKIGVAVAGTALAAYGAYKMSKILKEKAYKSAYDRGRKAASKIISSDMKKLSEIKAPSHVWSYTKGEHKAFGDANKRYAERASRTVRSAVKELLGKNRELTPADIHRLQQQGFSLIGRS